jgi:hypothetical protein
MNAKSLTDRLTWIATATFVIASVDIFSQPVVHQSSGPPALSAKNKVDSELITKFARMWHERCVVSPPERPLEFQTNLQHDFLRRASNLQIDFLRRAFEQIFAPFAALAVADRKSNQCAATQGLRAFSGESKGLGVTLS